MQTLFTASSPRIAIDVEGDAATNKQGILFLHGIGGNRTNWRDQVAFFAARGYRAAALDFRGYGESEDYEGPLNFAEDFSNDVLRALDTLGMEQAHICGLSMGGRVARWFHSLHPGRVASLTLANTQPGFDAFGAQATEDFVAARLAPLTAGHEIADIAHELARGLIGVSAVPGAYERLVASMAALHRTSYMKTVRASVEQDRGFNLATIQAPTLVIASSEDKLYTPQLAESMAQKIPGATFTLLPRGGHLSNMEQPDLFNAAMLAFLSGL